MVSDAKNIRKWIKWTSPWSIGNDMFWGMDVYDRHAAYIVRTSAKDGVHRYKYRAEFYDYLTGDRLSGGKTFYSLVSAKKYVEKKYIEHYAGA